MIPVWDPVVRVFHWSLVASFAIAWITANRAENAHMAAGYAAFALALSRLAWGFAAPGYARFDQFVRGPREVVAYLRAILAGSEARHLGHNPAGGAMIVALLAAISLMTATGWLLTTDAFWGSTPAQHVHSLVVHGALLLVVAHIGGVALASLRHRENLVRAMIVGDKRPPEPSDVA